MENFFKLSSYAIKWKLISAHTFRAVPSTHTVSQGFSSKEFACNAGDTKRWVQSLGQEDSPGGRNSNPLQYSCLGNPMDRGAWQATVHGVAKTHTWLSMCMHTYTHTHTHTHTQAHRKSSILYIITTDKFICVYLFLSSLSSQEKHSIYSH